METKKEDEGYEMPIPEEAKGMRILLIDSDVASLMHTTSMLEQATYKVTSAAMPDVALSLMQERVNQYDLVMAAVQLTGMDCISFLRLAKMVSNIPVAFMSYKDDLQTAIRSIQQGACQYFMKPISQNDIRGLWQFILRKDRNVPKNDDTVNHSNVREVMSVVEDTNGKGKEVVVETEEFQEHENLSRDKDDGEGGKETEKPTRKRKKRSEDEDSKEEGKEAKGKKQKKKRVKWNAELHAKFMEVLRAESRRREGAGEEEASDISVVTQAATQPQLQFTSQNSGRNLVQLNHPSGRNLVQTREANRLQSQSIGTGGLRMANFGGLRGAGREEYTSHVPLGTGGMNHGIGTRFNENTSSGSSFSYNIKSRFGVGQLDNDNLRISHPGVSLTERVDQIRRAYRTNSESGEASIENQIPVMNDSNQIINQAMRTESIESMMRSGAKRNRSQYENTNSGNGDTVVENYGRIETSNGSINFGFHPLQNVTQPNPNTIENEYMPLPNCALPFMQNACSIQTESSQNNALLSSTYMTLPNPAYYAGQVPYTPLENYTSVFMQNAPQTGSTYGILASRDMTLRNPNPNIDFMQNACNLQNELFQGLNYPIWSTNNDGTLGSRDMPTGIGDGMPLEAGLVNQAERLTSDFGFGNTNSSEGFPTSAQAGHSTPNDDDASLDEIFAELQPHFVDDEIRNSISNNK